MFVTGLEDVKVISNGCSKRLQTHIVLNVPTYVQPKPFCPDTMGNVYCVKSTMVTRHFLFRSSEEAFGGYLLISGVRKEEPEKQTLK